MNDSLAPGIAAWLLTYAIHSTVLLGLAWLVLRVRRAEPAVADLLWKVALVGGVVTATAQAALDLRPAGTMALQRSALVEQPTASLPFTSPDATASDPVASTPPSTGTRPQPQAAIGDPATAGQAWSTAAVVTGAWFAVALLLLGWYGGRRLILVGRLGDRRVLVDGPLHAQLRDLCEQAGIARRVRLTASNAISSPVALGNGEICLPAAALGELEPAQQRAMLAHELAHLVRRDPQWLAFSCVLERIFFFQPLNRLARRGLQESAEYLADEWAARKSGGVPLARCLVKVAEWIEASPLGVPVAGMAEQRSQLSVRVTRLLERGVVAVPRRQPLTAMLSVGVLVAMTALAPGVARQADAPEPAVDRFGIPTDVDLGLDGETPLQDVGGGTSTPADAARDGDRNTRGANTSSNTNTNHDDGVVTSRERQITGSLSGDARDTTVVRALMQRLKDEDAEVRQAAAYALGRIENPMAIPALVDALADSDREVQEAALDALSSFDRGIPAAPIRRMLTAEDPEMRQRAIQILAEMKDRESTPAIARLVSDPDAEVRQQAIWALSELGEPGSASAVAAGLADQDPEVRQMAIEAMCELGATIPAATLTRLLQDPVDDVRQMALHYVAELRVAAAVPHVVRMLDDPASDVREEAAEALAEIRTPESRAALRRALDHQDPQVRRIAVEFFGDEGDQ